MILAGFMHIVDTKKILWFLADIMISPTDTYVNQGNLVGLEGKAPDFFFKSVNIHQLKILGINPKKFHQDIFISFKVIHWFVVQSQN